MMSKLSADVLKTTGGRAATFAFTFVYFSILARVLQTREMAALAVFYLLCGLSSMAASLGLQSAAVQRAPELLQSGEFDRADSLLSAMVWVPFLASLALAAGVFAAGQPIAALLLKDGGLAPWVRWMALGIPLYRLQESGIYLLWVHKDFGRQVLARWLSDMAGRLVALGLYLRLGLPGYIIGLGLGYLTSALFAISAHAPTARLDGVSEWGKYSRAYYGYGFLRFGTMQADQLVVGILLSTEALAAYYVARRFYDAAALLIDSFVEPIQPRFSERRSDPQELARTFRKSSRYLALATSTGAFAVVGLSPILIRLVGGGKYAADWPLVAALGAGLVPYAYSIFVNATVFAVGRTREVLFMESVYGTANPGLAALLAGSLGPLGVSVAKGVSLAVGTLFARFRLTRYARVELDPAARRLPLLLAAPAAMLCLACGPMLAGSAALRLALGGAGIAVAVAATLATVGPEEKAQLLKAVGSL